MASNKSQKGELVAICRLEFYRKQKNWKFCSQERGQASKKRAKSTKCSRSKLNQTYSIEPKAEQPKTEAPEKEQLPDLDEAFVETENGTVSESDDAARENEMLINLKDAHDIDTDNQLSPPLDPPNSPYSPKWSIQRWAERRKLWSPEPTCPEQDSNCPQPQTKPTEAAHYPTSDINYDKKDIYYPQSSHSPDKGANIVPCEDLNYPNQFSYDSKVYIQETYNAKVGTSVLYYNSNMHHHGSNVPLRESSMLHLGALGSNVPHRESSMLHLGAHGSNVPHRESSMLHLGAHVSCYESNMPHQIVDVPNVESSMPYSIANVPYRECSMPCNVANVPYRECNMPHHETDLRYRESNIPEHQFTVPLSETNLLNVDKVSKWDMAQPWEWEGHCAGEGAVSTQDWPEGAGAGCGPGGEDRVDGPGAGANASLEPGDWLQDLSMESLPSVASGEFLRGAALAPHSTQIDLLAGVEPEPARLSGAALAAELARHSAALRQLLAEAKRRQGPVGDEGCCDEAPVRDPGPAVAGAGAAVGAGAGAGALFNDPFVAGSGRARLIGIDMGRPYRL